MALRVLSVRMRAGLRRRLLPMLVAALCAAVHATAAWAFDPFTVKDIRVEGVQRTEAGTIFSYLPIKVGERVDDEKVAQAVKALYATGFFRDVRIEAQGDVLLVTVQERPTISSLTFVGNKEFDTETIKKALKDVGIAEARIFDRSALERAEQELKRQYITRGKYAAQRADHRHAAGAQPRGDQLHDRRRRNRQHRQDQHRRHQGVHRARAAPRDDAGHAELAVVVHEGRPVFEAEALRRPGDAAQLLPEPRLSRVHHRVHAGVDLARQGRGVHHGEHQRGAAASRCPGSASPASWSSPSRKSAG